MAPPIRDELAIDVRGDHPDGLIFSASGPIEDGWRVIDVWESRAHFDAFATSRIGPAGGAEGELLPVIAIGSMNSSVTARS